MHLHLIHFSESCLKFLLTPSAKASVLALIAFTLTVALRKWMAPRWRHLLWLLVFIRLVVPDVGAWQGSAHGLWKAPVEEARLEYPPVNAADLADSNFRQGQGFTPPPASLSHPSVKQAEAAPESVGPPEEPVNDLAVRHFSTWELAGVLWLGGAMVMLATMLACGLRFQRRVMRGARPADRAWLQTMAYLQDLHGWRKVPEVWMSEMLSSPVLTGLWRPRIVLPAKALLENLNRAQRRHLLLHEMAHARWADLWMQTGAAVLLAVHWFNPLVWLACRRLRAESEACADAWVVRHEGDEQAREYGGTLVQLVAQSASWVVLLFAPGMLGMSGSGSELRERLTELARGQRRNRQWTLAALALILLTTAVTFTRPVEAQTPAAPMSVSIRGQVVDEAGKPVEGAKVTLKQPDYPTTGKTEDKVSDKEGRFHFDGKIHGQTVSLAFNHGRYAYAEEKLVTWGEPNEVKLVLEDSLRVTGKVTDATSGEPVANARVYLGRRHYQDYDWALGKSALTDAQGSYQILFRSARQGPAMVRVESDQHATYVSAPTEFSKARVQTDAMLQPKRLLDGQVVDWNGKPVEGALVWVAEGKFDSRLQIDQAWFDLRAKRAAGDRESAINKALTNAEGKFALKEVDTSVADKSLIVAVTPAGIARVDVTSYQKDQPLTLMKWSTLKARFIDAHGEPMAKQEVWAICTGLEVKQSDYKLRVTRIMSGMTDDEGAFTFHQILPNSEVNVRGDERAQSQKMLFAAGETQALTFTSKPENPKPSPPEATRQVIGRVKLPSDVTLPVGGTVIEILNPDGSGRSQSAICAKDGRFVVPGTAPGRYVLSAYLADPKRPKDMRRPIASGGLEFAFAADPAHPDFDLGEVQLSRSPISTRLETLPLPKGSEGIVKLKFEDQQGRPVAGVKVSGYLIYPDYASVIGSDDLAQVGPFQSDEDGSATVKFPRDLPGRMPIAAASLHVEKSGFVDQFPYPMTDGQTETVTMLAPPVLQVRGVSRDSKLSASFGGEPVPLKTEGEVISCRVPVAFQSAFIIVDQTDPKRWSFSPVESADFQSGKTHVYEAKLSKGVAIEGRVTGIPTPIQGDAWAHAEVLVEPPLPTGTSRPAAFLPGIFVRPIAELRWTAWSPVNSDGTFYFPGVPRGKLRLQVIGPGWVMEEKASDNLDRRGRELTDADDVLHITRGTEPAGKERVQVLAPDGTPAQDADVRFYRTMSHANNGYVLRGAHRQTQAHVASEHQAAFQSWLANDTPGHRVKTGPDGIAIMDNLPEGRTDIWVTWKDPKTGQLHRRQPDISVVPGSAIPSVVDLSKGELAR